MSAEETSKRESDNKALIAILIILCAIAFFFIDSIFVKLYLIYLLVFSFVCAAIGKERRIGYYNAFYLSFFFGGLVGLIVALTSRRLDDIPGTGTAQNININTNTSITDELIKLDHLRSNGIISEEEFIKLKERLIS
jgi:hypothetical protein